MAKKENNPAPRQVKLLTGINFTAEGETEETRIESGEIIDDGVLPAAFQISLIERNLAQFIN